MTYSNQGGTTNTNPVILDSNGEANVWIDPSLTYKFVLKDASDVTQWTVDQVSGAGGGGAIGGWSSTVQYSSGDIVGDSSSGGILYVSLTDNNLDNPLTDVSHWRIYEGKLRSVSTNSALVLSDNLVLSDSTGAALTHTLPAAASTPIGKSITVKDVGTGGHQTSVKGAGSDLIDTANIYPNTLNQGDSMTFQNVGSRWVRLGVGSQQARSPITFDVVGIFYSSFVKDDVLIYRVNGNIALTAAYLLVKKAGVSGSVVVDVEYKRGAGAWTTIFSSTISAAYSSGDNSLTQGTLAVQNLLAGDLLRLNIDGVQASMEDFSVYLENANA